MKAPDVLIALLAAILLVLAAGIYIDEGSIYERFLVLVVVSSGLFSILTFLVIRYANRLSVHVVYALVIAGIVYRVIPVGVGPVASDDIHRYIWDGKIQAGGVNPYRYPPSSAEVDRFRSEDLPAKINFPEMRTVYPPLAEWVFWLTYLLAGETVVGFKITLLLAELLTLFLLLILLRQLNRPIAFVLLYAWCPLPVFQYSMDGHLDALMLPFVLLFLLLWRKRHKVRAMIALGMSALVKLVSILYLPLVARDVWKERIWIILIIPLLALLLAYLPYVLSDGAPFESLGVYSLHWTFNGSLFQVIEAVTGNNQYARLTVMVLLLLWLAFLAYANTGLKERVFWATFGFILLAPTVHPWYIGWLAVLLPLHFRWSALALIALSSISNIVGVVYHSSGVWNEPPWLPYVQYLPVFVLLLLEATHHGLEEPRSTGIPQ